MAADTRSFMEGVQSVANGSVPSTTRSGISEISNFRIHLSPEAQHVYDNRIHDPIIERNHHYLPFVSFAKVIDRTTLVPEWAIRKLAALFNKLVRRGYLGHGILAPAAQLNLAPRGDPPNELPRVALIFYCFPTSKLTKGNPDPTNAIKKLNDLAGNNAFAEEGCLADSDWDSLPDPGGWLFPDEIEKK